MANETIKAIPTEYNEIKFRSRLEARWAVFFDSLNIKYFYEYEGYQLLSGWYLPDFFLPNIGKDGLFVEIKPFKPEKIEENLCNELALLLKKRVVLQVGNVDYTDEFNENQGACDFRDGRGYDFPYLWCECPKCKTIGIEFDGRAARICKDKCFPDDDKVYNYDSRRLIAAYKKAQKYSFWQGKT